MRKTNLLIVDDRRDLRYPLKRYPSDEGSSIGCAENAVQAREYLERNSVDLVVLDIMMPGEDGLSLCRHIRDTKCAAVILLTAKGDEIDRIVGLEIGADDYLTKPFNPRELLARIRNVLRRQPQAPSPTLDKQWRVGDWLYLPTQRTLQGKDKNIRLSTSENNLLRTLIAHPGQIFERDHLLNSVHGREAQAFDRAVDNIVSRLRKKIEPDPANPTHIETVWGGGYRCCAKVERL